MSILFALANAEFKLILQTKDVIEKPAERYSYCIFRNNSSSDRTGSLRLAAYIRPIEHKSIFIDTFISEQFFLQVSLLHNGPSRQFCQSLFSIDPSLVNPHMIFLSSVFL